MINTGLSFSIQPKILKYSRVKTISLKSKVLGCDFLKSSIAISFLVLNFNNQIVHAEPEGKSDKAFQLCLSKCIYSSTRPPEIGASTERLENTIPRNEVIKDCKLKCATDKSQLLLGQPKPVKK